MRILHTADWHLGRRLEGRSRHDEQRQALDEICRIADDERVDAVLVAGDVYDTYSPPAESEALFYETMVRLAAGGRRAVVVIAGNHDSPDRLLASDAYARSLGISTLGYPKDTPILFDGGSERVSCIESAPSFIRLAIPGVAEPLTVLALPYPSEARLREVLTADISDDAAAAADYDCRVRQFMKEASARFVAGGANIVASHLFVRDGIECESERQIQVGGAYTVDAESFPPEATYVALGHLHRPQEQHGRQDVPIRYSGSILQYSFSEAGQRKEVTVIEIDGGRTEYRSIPLGAGRSLACWDNVAGMEELERRLAASDPLAWLSITVALDEPIGPDAMARLREIHPGVIHCMPKYSISGDATARAHRTGTVPLDVQFRHYVETKFKEPVSDGVMRLFLELSAGDSE